MHIGREMLQHQNLWLHGVQHQNLWLHGCHSRAALWPSATFTGTQLHSEKCSALQAFMMRAGAGLEATPRSCKLVTCLTAAMKNLK